MAATCTTRCSGSSPSYRPQTENGDERVAWYSSVRSYMSRRPPSSANGHHERRADGGEGEREGVHRTGRPPPTRAGRAGRAAPAAAPSASGANFVRPAEAASAPRASAGEVAASRAADDQRRDQRVVGVRRQRVERERVGGPAVGQREPERRGPAGARPSSHSRGSSARRRPRPPRARPGRSSQLPAPRPQPLPRDVGEVGHRAVGVAVLVVLRPVAVQPLAARRSGRRR